MNANAIADAVLRIARVVFVDHVSVCISCLAVGISIATFLWNVAGSRPRVSVSFELLDARMLPRAHFVESRILVTNVGRCAFSIRHAGFLLVNGFFAPSSGHSLVFPHVLQPGESIVTTFNTNAYWLVYHPFVPAIELGNGRLYVVKPFFSGFDSFVTHAATLRAGELKRRRRFSRRLRHAFVKNARHKREDRKQ